MRSSRLFSTLQWQDPIYILGVGNLGKLVAHAVRKQFPATPVTLLLHRESLLASWEAAGRAIECRTPDGTSERTAGFLVETLSTKDRGPGDAIKKLVVATKTYRTTAALSMVKHRLGYDSSILFLQNGMGTTDEVSAALFPSPQTRPKFWAGIASAGVYPTGPFSIVHAGRGPLVVGAACGDEEHARREADDGMIRCLLEARDLDAKLVTPHQLRAAQLQKLVVNAMINPLTVVFDCTNGEVFNTPLRMELLRLLVAETGPVVRSLLPQPVAAASGDDPLQMGFSDEQLLGNVLAVAEKTGRNTSSMLQDARAGRETEIDYINGYIVSQARRRGLSHARNAALLDMVKRRRSATDAELLEHFT